MAGLALLMTVVQFWVDYQDRVSERVVRAWSLVTTPAPGNSGKREALEYLNREDGWLCVEWLWDGCAIVLKRRSELVGIDLSASRLGESGAYLSNVNLREAILFRANLVKADLAGANLSMALLVKANLSEAFLSKTNLSRALLIGAWLPEAHLSEADLSGADLSGAKLSGADLPGADLSRADLFRADLSGADLSEATNLTQQQLDKACAAPNNPPHLPKPLIWKSTPCPAPPPAPA